MQSDDYKWQYFKINMTVIAWNVHCVVYNYMIIVSITPLKRGPSPDFQIEPNPILEVRS